MKRVLVLVILCVVACSGKKSSSPPAVVPDAASTSVVATADAAAPIDAAPPTPAGVNTLVEVEIDDPSCVGYKVVDPAGKPVALPKGVDLDCWASLSPDGRLLFYMKKLGVYVVDLVAGAEKRIVALEEQGYQGHGGMEWSPDNQRVALVAINSEKYKQQSRLFVWTVADHELVDKQRFEVAVGFECGGTCYPLTWRFKDHRTIEYFSPGADGPPDDDKPPPNRELKVK